MLFSIDHKDFESLKASYPKSADQLEALVERIGPKSIIHLDQITAQIQHKIDTDLYDFLYRTAYNVREENFWSYGLQLREILNLPKSKVRNILEIGPGTGMLESLLSRFDYQYYSLDIKPYNKTNIRGNLEHLPIAKKSVDLICAFEVLQHLPHDKFEHVLQELVKSARHFVYLSLPYPTSSIYFQYRLSILSKYVKPFTTKMTRLIKLPFRLQDKKVENYRNREDSYNPHYWEVNRKSYPQHRILSEIESNGLKVQKTFHNPFHPYHFFILCEIR